MKEDQKNFKINFTISTNEKFKLIIIWKTRNLKSLFPVKDKDLHPYARHIRDLFL